MLLPQHIFNCVPNKHQNGTLCSYSTQLIESEGPENICYIGYLKPHEHEYRSVRLVQGTLIAQSLFRSSADKNNRLKEHSSPITQPNKVSQIKGSPTRNAPNWAPNKTCQLMTQSLAMMLFPHRK